MPGQRGPDRSRIEDALAALTGALSEVGAPWMVIGGIAVIAHGVQRMTTDIDAVIQGDAVSVNPPIDSLRRHQIVPRIEDAAAFAAANLVLLTRHRPTEVDLDLSFGWTAFEHAALAARARNYGCWRKETIMACRSGGSSDPRWAASSSTAVAAARCPSRVVARSRVLCSLVVAVDRGHPWLGVPDWPAVDHTASR